jgi:amino acid adenylation domain-containing protein
MDINVEEISVRDKRELLAELLRRRASKPVVVPLSFAQQRLWFLDQLEPGSPLYNVHSAVRLQGRLDVAALEQSFEFMVQRHETLRTTFQLQNGTPVQVIQAQAGLVVERCDLEENLPRKGAKAQSKTQKDVVGEILEEEALKPFDLANGPLLRVKLLRLGEDDHVLSLTMHHIVSDGWSMGVLISEVVALYEAFSKGETPSLPELPIQYADFTRWQREWLTGDVLAKQLGYWQKQLDDVATLQLPTDRPRPLIRSQRGARQSFALPRDLSESLIALARTEGVTLFTLLLAAWQTLLTRYTEQTDIVVGSPIANRNRVETESLIGFFVNTLVLRTDFSGNPTFCELLERVRSVVLDAQAHQDVPFEKIVDELQLERSLSHTPLFQVVFALHNTPPAQVIDLPGLKLTSLDVQLRTAKFDIVFELFERNGNINGSLEYNTDLFDNTTIARLLGHYQRLLSAIVADPEQKILDLPLLSDAEERQLLYDWNEVSPDTESEQLLHELFAEQAQRTPDQIALVLEDKVLTYSELNARASRLAQHLCELGVGPETLVGIFMERSIEMVVAILGILKAGGAYVPLDPSYPHERLRFIVEDAKPAVIVTQEALRPVAGELGAVLTIDDTDQSRGSAPDLIPRFAPSNPAYVIYTSGSTGTPKGVVVTHANVVRLFTATRKWFNFDANDVWTLFHSYAFDFSVWELWGALLYGGRLVIVPYLVSRQPEAFYQLLVKERVTVLNQTPSAFRQLMQAEQNTWPIASEAPPLALRFVIFGGEALELQSLAPWFERHGDEQPLLVNMYGITETTVHVTYRPIRKSDLLTATGSVIGERIPDLQIYVLDAARKPVPIGVPGELYVGGAGLARGYLQRPALTAERFVTHPWDKEGARLYRTGDRGRYLANGDLEYLGRVDRQVKVRGFRIELGEIEAVLAQHKDVSESIVIARDDDGETRLVAYVVAAETVEAEQALTVSSLRSHMKERLPEYMVPSAFVLLDRLPLTTNGKVDRRALPAPEESRLDLGEAYVAPETEEEKILADVWAEVLHVERVGVCDNYFALGGDSIRSVRVLSLAKERGLNFSLQQLFQYQTIRELARSIDSEKVTSGQSRRTEPFGLVKDEDRQKLPADVVDAYPLSRLQLGMLYHLQATPGVSVYHNINSWHLKARLNEELFVEAVKRVVARHAVLRTSFDLSSYSEPLQLVHREAELPVQFEDLRGLSPADQQEVIKIYTDSEQRNLFDLSRPTLLRFCIHRRTDESFQFTLTELHAILDGWSLLSTLAEVFQTHFALLRNEPLPEHKPFATSFRDFIALEQASLESEECRRFWQDSLSDATVTEITPWAAESSTTARKRLRDLGIPTPDDISEGLHRLAVNAAVPFKSVLLAAHMKVMSLVMGQSDVITGLVCNGRPEETDGELIRGLFLNVIPFRQRVEARNWTEFVRDTFNIERSLLPFRRYPLPAIQEQLNTPSFFETTFNYVHFHVLDGVLGRGDAQILHDKADGYEQTNFTLNAGFMSDILTSRVRLRIAVDPAKVSEPQGEAIRGYYERVLAAMARDTFGPLETEPFLDDAERHKVLVEWNDTARDFPHDKCFQELFEEQVKRTPDAEAVVFGEQALSYRELNRRANRLAHHLRSLGVGPETLVGISVERSIEMVVGLLGILKAGGAFVPLDPAYPRDRLAFMIDDSGIRVLLTQEKLRDVFPHYDGEIIYLDRPDRSYSDENLDSNTTPQNAAYVIYTSGSTGTPKGVVIAHRGLCNLATAQIRAFNVQPSSRVLQFAALSFDASVTEFAMALLRGATLVIASREDLMPGERLISLLRNQEITTVTFPPSVLALLPPEELPALRTIIVAGEACWAELVERWAVNGRLFCNAYGPTENTVCISIAECTPDGRKPTIGRALANVQVYVLDENMRPAPLGVPGEIYAGGEGLARAYLNRPDLTATRFVPNPYSTVPGARLYRTGDRGRYLPDGQLEFLGRVDQQVKLRGFRIELGEIEAVLCRHDAVRDAIVVAREERNGEKRLVAYVVGEAPTAELPSQLRSYLHERLPDYMVPSAWVMLDALPLTANGKVDRKALPAPDSQRPELPSAYIAPRSAIERDIAAVWQEVLGIENIGVNDKFFDLGGHSLQAVRVHGKLRTKFEKNLLLFELFQFPTIAAMAKYISNDYPEESSAEQGVERAETRKELRSRRRQMRKAAGES